jgi:hypothetical protein
MSGWDIWTCFADVTPVVEDRSMTWLVDLTQVVYPHNTQLQLQPTNTGFDIVPSWNPKHAVGEVTLTASPKKVGKSVEYVLHVSNLHVEAEYFEYIPSLITVYARNEWDYRYLSGSAETERLFLQP